MSSGYYGDERIFSTLTSRTGIPGAHIAFGDEKPPCPRFLYRMTNGGEVHADGTNYAALPHYQARLYLDAYDSEVVEAFAAAVGALGPYRHSDEWSDENGGKLVAVFDFTLTDED